MDEEELEQPSSKINLGSFFERVDSVEKVANNALSRANANLGIINNQKLIINSLSVTIEAMETKIRDIANYIIIEKKLEKDVEEDRLLEEQDRLQKQAMVERATTIMGEPGPQGEPGQPAEKQKGSSLLGTLLRLGIGAFAIKFLWPAILPALKGVLAGVLKGVFSWTGLKLAALLGGIIGSIPLIGKFGPKIKDGIVDTFSGISSWVENLVKGVDKDGRVSDGAGGGTGNPTNVRGSGQRQPLLEGDESMRDTLTEKDLMVTPGTRIDEYGAEGGGEPSSGDLSMFDEEEENKFEVIEGQQNITADQLEREIAAYETKIEKMEAEGKNEEMIEFEREKMEMKKQTLLDMKSGLPVDAKTKYKFVESNTENKDLDLSLGNIGGETDTTGNNDANLLSQVLETPSTNNGQVVTAPSNTPNTTDTTVKITKIPVPFLNSISNQYLSITGEKIPPEFYRQYA